MPNNLTSFIKNIDRRITNNLDGAKVKTRPDAGNGLYLLLLLPLLMLTYCIRYHVTPLYLYTSCLSLGLLTYSVLLVVFLSLSQSILDDREHAGSLTSGLIATLVSYGIGEDIIFALLVCLPFTYMYSMGVKYALKRLPQCFTLGEAMMVMQGVTLFAFSAVVRIHKAMNDTPKTDADVCCLVVQIGLLAVALIIIQSCWMSKDITALILGNGITIFVVFLFLHIVLGRSAIIWVLLFIADRTRISIISSWAVWVAFAIVTVRLHIGSGDKANTRTRKIFHVLAVAVYLPGLLLDTDLMTLASGVALAGLLLIETLRKLEITPFSNFLNIAFDIYSDKKDVGGISLTPIYLLVGVSCPLALIPNRDDASCRLQLLSGVISIGIGDAMASWLGSRYGKVYWSGSQRTMEGTFFNILAQFFTVYLLYGFGYLEGDHLLQRGAAAAVVSGLTEAFTDQVDNLVLPIVTLLTLAMC